MVSATLAFSEYIAVASFLNISCARQKWSVFFLSLEPACTMLAQHTAEHGAWSAYWINGRLGWWYYAYRRDRESKLSNLFEIGKPNSGKIGESS